MADWSQRFAGVVPELKPPTDQLERFLLSRAGETSKLAGL
jgi:hypothetical protein